MKTGVSAARTPPAGNARGQRLVRGVSLVEALVALAVMGFGMVGLVGMQSNLRANADVARQRAEAVRLAHAQSELARAYSVLSVTAGLRAYDDLTTVPAQVIPPAPDTGNTAYTLTQTVTAFASPRRKTVAIDLAWEDRTGQPQSVRLATVVSGAPPELAAALSVPTDDSPMQRPLGRHAGVPRDAVPIPGTETSQLDLAPLGGAAGSYWVFDNTSGAITQVCSSGCTPYLGRLLTGFVRFSTEAVTPSDAGLNPGGLVGSAPALAALGVAVQLTAPTTDDIACLQRVDVVAQALEYFCAVPVTAPGMVPPPPQQWSGRSRVTGPGLTLADSPTHPAADRFRVCRYTPVRAHTPAPPLRNVDHPLDYVNVDAPLANQNFLVIRAGNGTAANTCPGIGGQPGNTFDHQPHA